MIRELAFFQGLKDHAPKREEDVDVSRAILPAGIREDLPAVRTAATEVAETSTVIRSTGEADPDVTFAAEEDCGETVSPVVKQRLRCDDGFGA